MTHVLELDRITKRFGPLLANDEVSLSLAQGEVLALLGENGAGKTTLMNILYGLYQPDGGVIRIAGLPVVIPSPRRALELGIGMIHQHFMLVGSLTVTENVVLGLPGQGARLHLRQHEARLRELSRSVGFEVEPTAPVWTLPIGMRQRVEILKALYRNV